MTTADRLYDAIVAYYREHGFSPSFGDLMAATGISTTSLVAYNLRLLRRQGRITFSWGMARSIRLAGPRCACCGGTGVRVAEGVV